MSISLKPISISGAVLLFGIPAVGFIAVCRVLVPYFHQNFGLHPALSWFIGGLLTFLPLFLLALFLARKDGFLTKAELSSRFRLKKMSNRDWKFALGGLLLIFIGTGLIMGISKLLHLQFGIPEIETTPSFMKFEPFQGKERLLLLVWLVMFFFNIFGEELLWRGYILPRQELALGQSAWMLNSALWFVFHVAFGIDLLILLLPILIVLPWCVQKTGNTMVGIWIHGLMNGPMFILVSLGIIG
ncbi:MAG: CPBP family intramembrane metalloprotease [Prolixibacteraceae bacterium]|nr:CPBP family intramembrane metalloprotease [Prolixibacteraceae bacterium]